MSLLFCVYIFHCCRRHSSAHLSTKRGLPASLIVLKTWWVEIISVHKESEGNVAETYNVHVLHELKEPTWYLCNLLWICYIYIYIAGRLRWLMSIASWPASLCLLCSVPFLPFCAFLKYIEMKGSAPFRNSKRWNIKLWFCTWAVGTRGKPEKKCLLSGWTFLDDPFECRSPDFQGSKSVSAHSALVCFAFFSRLRAQ